MVVRSHTELVLRVEFVTALFWTEPTGLGLPEGGLWTPLGATYLERAC